MLDHSDQETSSPAASRRDGQGRTGARGAGRPSGPRKPRSWAPVTRGEDGEPVPVALEDWTEAQRDKVGAQCMNLALWHLARGPQTRSALLAAMVKHEVPVAVAEGVLDRVTAMGYVDDAAYAANLVASRTKVRRQGPRVIAQTLRAKGVAEADAQVALEAIDPDDVEANARALVAAKLGSSAGLERAKRTNRLVGMLARKGYAMGLAFQVVREALDAEGEEEEPWSEPVLD